MTDTDIYRAVRSTLPKKTEVGLWHEKKIMAFLHFFAFFVEDGRIRATVERRKDMEAHQAEHEFWPEFMARIEVPTGADFSSTALFTQRLITFSRVVLSYLKTNPHVITEEMGALMEKNPRCHWALQLFRMKQGKMGQETVQAADVELTSPHEANMAPASTAKRPEVMFNESLIRMTSLLRDMTKSIKKEDLKKMSTADKLKFSISSMKVVGSLVRKYTPNKPVFNLIHINSAKREDLEKSILDYAATNMQENDDE